MAVKRHVLPSPPQTPPPPPVIKSALDKENLYFNIRSLETFYTETNGRSALLKNICIDIKPKKII